MVWFIMESLLEKWCDAALEAELLQAVQEQAWRMV